MAKNSSVYKNHEMGKRVQKARTEAGFTQEKLAEKIGVTVQYISGLERGIVGTSVQTLVKLCDALHTTSDYLLFGSSYPGHLSAYLQSIQKLSKGEQKIIQRGVSLLEEALKYDGNDGDGSE